MPYPWPDSLPLPDAIPITFLALWHVMYGHPMRGYQAHCLSRLFAETYKRRAEDISFKMARQAGKTVPVSYFLSHQVVVESWPLVMLSSKEEKTRKIARTVLRSMRLSGRRMEVEGIKEARFEPIGGSDPGFICMSGKPMSEREGETARLVLADEAQDIDHETVWPDISPMLLSTGGSVLAMGIGGIQGSLIERLRDDAETGCIDIPWEDVLRYWLVPDGRDEDYRRRVLKDRRIMRPEIFAAHYECRPIPEGAAALYRSVMPWSQAYPGVHFDPQAHLHDLATRYTRVRLGIDWGKRQDFSCALLVASDPPRRQDGTTENRSAREIIICGYNKWEGMGYAEQLDHIFEWLDRPPPDDVPYDQVQPEINGAGDSAVDLLRRRLESDAKLRHMIAPVDMQDSQKLAAADIASQSAQSGRLIYVDAAAVKDTSECRALNLHLAEECARNLRAVGIRYSTSARGTLKTNFSHSDWNSALFAALHEPPRSSIR